MKFLLQCDFITDNYHKIDYIKYNKTTSQQKGKRVDLCTQYLTKIYIQEMN